MIGKFCKGTPAVVIEVALISLLLVGTGIVVASDDKSSDTTPNGAKSSEEIRWQVVASGATNGQGSAYAIKGTVGQTAVGLSQAVQYSVHHGFWQAGAADTSCCGRYTGGYTGNTDCDTDGKMNLQDVTRLIDRIYLSKIQLCCEENGDTNEDGVKDVTRLIDHIYLSKNPTAACR